MKIALGIFRLEPRGGLEDHCIRIAEGLGRRGHTVTVLSMVPGAVRSDLFATAALPGAGLPRSNHGRMREFSRRFAAATRKGFDRTVAFQPVPGVETLYCANPVREAGGIWKSLLPRQRTYAALEAACFGPEAETRIILLSDPQAKGYLERYRTPEHRIRVVPPSFEAAKRRPQLRTPSHRAQYLQRLGIEAGAPVLLWVGLQPEVKGLDRVIEALGRLGRVRLLIAGLDERDAKARPVRAQISARGLGERVRWLGYLRDVELAEAMAASDVLAHPARADVTGGVIVEAIINGLPAVATDVCGYARHIAASGAGVVIAGAFDLAEFVAALERCTGGEGAAMSQRGVAYGETADLFSGMEKALDLIEAADWAAI